MRRSARLGIATTVVTLAAACSSFDGAGTEETDARTDGGSGDAQPAEGGAADAGDALEIDVDADAGPPGLLFFEGFETSSGCGKLTSTGVTLQRVTEAYFGDGSASCKICFGAGGTLYANIPVASSGPGTYRLEARVKRAVGGGSWAARIDFINDGGLVSGTPTAQPLNGDWQFAQSIVSTASANDSVIGAIGGNVSADGCVYVDDVSLWYTAP